MLTPASAPVGEPLSVPLQAIETTPWLEPFTLRHAIVVVIATILLTAVLLLAKRADKDEPRLRSRLAGILLVIAALNQAWWMWPSRFDLEQSLPIHVCDVMTLVAPVSLLVLRNILQTITYFVGLGLSSHAFITPVDSGSPESPKFWLFWTTHAGIVLAALYHVIVLGYRPRFRDLLAAIGCGVVYTLLTLPINAACDFNYGYMGSTEDQPGIIGQLGPWPLRIIWLGALGSLALFLVWIPSLLLPKPSNQPDNDSNP